MDLELVHGGSSHKSLDRVYRRQDVAELYVVVLGVDFCGKVIVLGGNMQACLVLMPTKSEQQAFRQCLEDNLWCGLGVWRLWDLPA